MAIIQTIRTRAGILLAVVIGLALLAFILTDLFSSGGSLKSRAQMNVAEINGSKIGYREYQNKLAVLENVMKTQYQTSQLNEGMMESIRNQAWQDLIQDHLLAKEYNKLGLAVSNAEFSDLIQGANPHPLVAQMFMDPQTGGLNRLQLRQFLSQIDEISGAPKMMWVFYEDVINNERLLTKYNTLISKGLYANKLQVAQQQDATATSVDFSFVKKAYTEIADSAVTVTDAEMKKYYKDHISKYQQNKTRDIMYVAFDIKPSQEDIKDAENWIIDSQDEFAAVEDVEQYINFNSPPYDRTNYGKGELSDELDAFMFSSEAGAVYGPYFEDNSYKLAKLAKVQYLSDSVRASHILLPADQSNAQQIRALADSLKTAAENGISWEQLVNQNSKDLSTAIAGGDLGWFQEGFKSPYFSDSCFYAQKGDIKVSFSDDGFHVIKITAKSKAVKKVQVGVLAREVTPGSETDQVYYSQAVEFASKANSVMNFEKTAREKNLQIIPATGLRPMERGVAGLDQSRNLVNWAFSQEEAGVLLNDINNYNDKYVVAILSKVSEKGDVPFEEVEAEIKTELIKEKKAELLAQQLEEAVQGASVISDVAQNLNTNVLSASSINFASYMVQRAGNEPALIAAGVNSEEHSISSPVVGDNGVYLLSVDAKNTRETMANTGSSKEYMERMYASRANRKSMATLEELGQIEDLRYRFY